MRLPPPEPLMRTLVATLSTLLCGLATAAGLTTLPAPPGTGPVTVLYPTEAAPGSLQRGAFTLQATVDAPPARGNGRLIVLSHGSGGSVWPQFDLAQALVAAGFTVAMPQHAGDNWQDMGDVGPVSWERRPREVSQAIDAVAAAARLAPLQLDLQRVGAYGMSAGGLTALALGGGRWSPALLARHCDAHIQQDFAGCVGLSTELTGGVLDEAKVALARRVIRFKLGGDVAWRSWHEPRVAAVVAAVPMATPFDMASLARPRVPMGLVRSGLDAWLAPRFHIDAVRAACGEGCVLLADLARGGHGAMLSPMVPDLAGPVARLLSDPPGFERSALPQVRARIVAFFAKNLETRPAAP